MFNQKRHLAYITVLYKKRLGYSYTRIEIQIGHRHGILKDIPETFLCIEKIQIRSPWKCRTCKALRNRNLELDIGVIPGRPRTHRRTEYKIIVLI